VNKPDPTAADIARLRDASDWVQRLSESTDQELADQWMDWCRSDALNLGAFEQMQRLWDQFPEATNATSYSLHVGTQHNYRRTLIRWAASVLLLVGVVGWFALRYPQIQELETPVGEQRRVTLVDGSHLDLGPASRASTRFTLLRREVQLDRGQAFFAVAHDALRPFVVRVNGLTVTAVGTAFDVRIGSSSTVVTVSEGRVSVAPGASEAGRGRSISPETVHAGVGQRVTLSKSEPRLTVVTVDPTVAGSWREGTLLFVGEPLDEVVSEVNRYSARPIVVAPAVAQTRFTGTVSGTNVGDWLKALEQIFAVKVVDRGPNGILIQAETDNGTQK
jgi:transmembrane sensor